MHYDGLGYSFSQSEMNGLGLGAPTEAQALQSFSQSQQVSQAQTVTASPVIQVGSRDVGASWKALAAISVALGVVWLIASRR